MTRPRHLPTLLWIGEGVLPTGYGRVAHEVLSRLAGDFECVLFAVNHRRGGVPGGLPYQLITNALPDDLVGVRQVGGLLDGFGPDVVVVHGDSTSLDLHRSALHEHRAERPEMRVVAYMPLDWPEQPPAVPLSLSTADAVVTYTGSGAQTLRRACGSVGVATPELEVIPHGVDARRFAPLVEGDRARSRSLARERLWPDRPELRDAFVVLNANRNMGRKRIDLTLEGFAAFARRRGDSHLWLHMGRTDLGCDVEATAAALGIADRVSVTPHEGARPEVDDDYLRLLYNATDVGVNTADAEGFGLVAFEHAAVGVPQIVPCHGACAELWDGHARLAAPADLAAALDGLYLDVGRGQALGRAALDHARTPRFDWDGIARRWIELLVPLAEQSRPSPTPVFV